MAAFVTVNLFIITTEDLTKFSIFKFRNAVFLIDRKTKEHPKLTKSLELVGRYRL